MDRTVYLIRHGKIELGNEKRLVGRTDLPLSEEGIEQVRRIGASFFRVPLECAYTSPLSRCVDTADIVLAGRDTKIITVADFAEIDLGLWDNMKVSEIQAEYPEAYEARGKDIAGYIPPEGESFYQVEKRVMPAFETIFESTRGDIAIFAHAGVNRVIISHLLGLPINDLFNISQPYGCINILNWSGKSQCWSIQTRHYR
ncbi:MAG: alpha-ribazole phosphatase [Clostridiales bacterium]|nr:alpha-ribazole phosphatase [Clostridiales bacterium]